MEAESQKKELAPSLGSLTLGPEPVFLFSPHQEAAPHSHLPCLQCPGMPSAGNGPRRPRAVQRTEGKVSAFCIPPLSLQNQLPFSCASANLSFSQVLEQQWMVAGAWESPSSPLVFTIEKRI